MSLSTSNKGKECQSLYSVYSTNFSGIISKDILAFGSQLYIPPEEESEVVIKECSRQSCWAGLGSCLSLFFPHTVFTEILTLASHLFIPKCRHEMLKLYSTYFEA